MTDNLHPIFQTALAPFAPPPVPRNPNHALDETCAHFIARHPVRSVADFEVGTIVRMAAVIVAAFDPVSVASQFVDAMDLEPTAADVLQAAVDRRIRNGRRA